MHTLILRNVMGLWCSSYTSDTTTNRITLMTKNVVAPTTKRITLMPKSVVESTTKKITLMPKNAVASRRGRDDVFQHQGNPLGCCVTRVLTGPQAHQIPQDKGVHLQDGEALALQRRDQRKTKDIVLSRTYERIHRRKTLRIWHGFAASATYRASQEGAAKARAVALPAAIDAVAAEQDTRGKGAGACRLS